MTDPEKPAFHVVDRRHSASQAEPTPSSLSTGDVPADTSSAESDSNPAAPTPEKIEPNSFLPPDDTAEPGASEPDDSDTANGAMPDPGALLAYVAMQMDVKTIAGALLGVFAGHAWRAMGFVANPVTGKIEMDLLEAQMAIDCVQFLLGKVENDLGAEERREMQRRLNDLRMNYVVQLRENT